MRAFGFDHEAENVSPFYQAVIKKRQNAHSFSTILNVFLFVNGRLHTADNYRQSVQQKYVYIWIMHIVALGLSIPLPLIEGCVPRFGGLSANANDGEVSAKRITMKRGIWLCRRCQIPLWCKDALSTKGVMRKLSVKQAAYLMPKGGEWAVAEHQFWALNICLSPER